MDSTSPECSDGNDAASAPSEFLAEFLSAIMQRQYAEALKYCRLILQYEPHNATARGFYPLLQHKIQKHSTSKDESCSSEEPSLIRDSSKKDEPCEEVMEQEADESCSDSTSSERSERSEEASTSASASASCASQSSLELDSSGLELSRRTTTDPSDSTCWESSASPSDHDDNGNAPAAPLASDLIAPDDVENDNAGGAASSAASGAASGAVDGAEARAVRALRKAECAGASLRRLRAQFACSIK